MKSYDIFGGSSSKGATITQPQPTQTPVVGLFKQILGFNGQISTARYGFDNNKFCEVIKSTGATGMRTPGGTIGNSFKPFDPSSIPQPEDVANLKNITGANIFIMLNMLTSSLDEQLAWLKKLNSLGVNIFFLELGNEFPSDDFYAKFKTVENYVSTCRTWIAAIRKLYPNCYFAAPLSTLRKYNQGIYNKIDKDLFYVWHYHNREKYVDAAGVVDVAKVWSLIDSEYKEKYSFINPAQFAITEFNLKLKKDGTSAEEEVIFKDDEQHGIAARCIMEKFYKIGASVILFHNIEGAQGNGAVIQEANENIYLSPTGLAISEFIKSVQ